MPSSKKSAAQSQRKLPFDARSHQETAASTSTGPVASEAQQQRHGGEGRKRSSTSAPESTSNKIGRGMGKFESPKKRGTPTTTTAAAIVTPATDHRSLSALKPRSTRSCTAGKEYIPTYVHKNVAYRRQTLQDANKNPHLTPIQNKVFCWIRQNFDIPKDMEQSRAFGPLSGCCYEERVITAYALNKLDFLHTQSNDTGTHDMSASTTMICTACAELDHTRDQCHLLL